MKSRKLLIAALACAMVMSVSAPAFAAAMPISTQPVVSPVPSGFTGANTDPKYGGGENVTKTDDKPSATFVPGQDYTYTEDTNNGHTTPFVGVIKPTQIRATIPTKVVFDIDPTIEVYQNSAAWVAANSGKNPFTAQVTQPTADDLRITNHSAVPIYVYVDSVTTAVKSGTPVTLTSSLADINTAVTDADKDRYIMFGLKGLTTTQNKPPEFNATSLNLTTTPKDYWIVGKDAGGVGDVLAEGSKHYYLTDGLGTANKPLLDGQVKDFDKATGLNSVSLNILAVTKKGWAADDVFTIMPVFVVSVRNPDRDVADVKAPTVSPAPNVLSGVKDPKNP